MEHAILPPNTPLTPAAYNACVEEHSDALYRFALHRTRDRELAKDVVQESFLRLWQKLHTVEPGKERSYLFTTAHHFMISTQRHLARSVRMEVWHEDRGVSRPPEPLLREEIERGLDRLPIVQRRVVVLRDQEGYSYAEIADALGLTMEQVKVYIHRGRKAMQRFLGPAARVA